MLTRAAIRDDDSDAARLAYAEALPAADAPLAEFIRVQCAPSTEAGRAREDELLEAHAAEWLGPVGLGPEECTFRRGFVEGVTLSLAAGSHALADRVLALTKQVAELPALRHLRIGGARGRPIEDDLSLALGELAPWLRALDLLGVDLNDVQLRQLLGDAPPCPRLLALDLSRNLLSAEGLRALGATTKLSGLQVLRLDGVNLGPSRAVPEPPDAITALAPLAAQLTELGLACTWLDHASLAGLCTSAMPELRVLDLSSNIVPVSVAQELARGTNLPRLERIVVRGLFDDVCAALATRWPLERGTPHPIRCDQKIA